jgi:phage/plasmid-associated DNA primase
MTKVKITKNVEAEKRENEMGDKMIMFLNKHRFTPKHKEEGKKITHTEMNVSKGTYYIPDEDYKEFTEIYSNYINAGWEIGMVERHDEKKVGPVICDFDFRCKQEQRYYTQEDIKNIIKIFKKIMTNTFDVKTSQLNAYVYEKDAPTPDRKKTGVEYKDGFHIYWPNVPLCVEYRYLLYDMVYEELDKNKTLENIPSLEPLKEIFDYRVIYNNGIMMYGSSKPGRTPYKLTKVYDWGLEEVKNKDDIFDISSIRNFKDDSSLKLKDEKLITRIAKVCKQFNYESETYKNEIKEIILEEKKKKNEKEKKEKEKNENIETKETKGTKETKLNYDEVVVSRDKVFYERLLGALNEDRYTHYDEWLHLGYACKNENIFDLFDKYSKIKCPSKYEKGCCEKHIKLSSIDKKLTYKSLLYWLKKDNQYVYNELLSKTIDFSCLTPQTYADELNDILNEDILITYDDEIYKWNGVYWEKESRKILDNFIGRQLVDHFIVLINEKAKYSNYVKTEKHKIINKMRFSLESPLKCAEIINKFMSITAKKNIQWDNADYLFQFNNKLYNLKNGEFIKPNKELYIRTTCGYDFDNDDDNNDGYKKEKKEIIKYFNDIQDKDEAEFLLIYFASTLQRYNIDNKCLFAVGKGRNGKGVSTDLMRYIMGNYWGDLNMSYFTTSDKGSDTPNSNLSECKVARFICSSEIEETNDKDKRQKIITSKFKNMTGSDILAVRNVYGREQTKFRAGSLCLQVNFIPKFGTEEAMKQRVMVLNFDYTFTDEPKKKNEKKLDSKLREKFLTNEYRQAFIRVLFDYYKIYNEKGLSMTKKMIKDTNKVFGEMNEVSGFMGGLNIQYTGLDKDYIKISDLHCMYSIDNEITASMFSRELNKVTMIKDQPYEIKMLNGYKVIRGFKLIEEKEENEDKFSKRII